MEAAHYLGLQYATGNHAVALRLGEGSHGQRLDLIKSGQDTDNVSFRVSLTHATVRYRTSCHKDTRTGTAAGQWVLPLVLPLLVDGRKRN
jgi:hypothetical protein